MTFPLKKGSSSAVLFVPNLVVFAPFQMTCSFVTNSLQQTRAAFSFLYSDEHLINNARDVYECFLNCIPSCFSFFFFGGRGCFLLALNALTNARMTCGLFLCLVVQNAETQFLILGSRFRGQRPPDTLLLSLIHTYDLTYERILVCTATHLS